MIKKYFALITLLFLAYPAFTQQRHYATLTGQETEQELIKIAANIVPTPRQLRWQELELTAFFHFGVNTFTGKEWGNGKEDPKIFDPKKLNAEQWVKTVKNAGYR